VYSAAGTYTVAATVYDNLNASSVATSPVTVTAPGVYVTSPTAATGTLTSSVHVVASAASAAGITAMKIYLDNTSVYNTSAGAFDTYIAAATGTHSLVVQAWDKTGVVYKNGQYISVVDQPPAAVLSVTPTSGSAPLSVSASTSGSSDPDGSIASSKINFGDGSILIAASATHQYSVPGAYTVTATVTDNVGASSTATRTVTVAGVKVSTPTAGATVGSPVHFVAAAIAVSPIKAMRIYVDNMSRYVTYAASLDAYINVSKGSHYVVVQAWDSTGEVYKTPLTINVQ
jgi:PKD repeat protein